MIRSIICKICGRQFSSGNRGAKAESCSACRTIDYHNRYIGKYYLKHPRKCKPRYDKSYISPALERAGHKCERCGLSNVRLNVHHKDGNGTTSVIPNNNPANLRVLCDRCHLKAHGALDIKRYKRIRHLKDKKNLTFEEIGRKEKLTKQRIAQIYHAITFIKS